ncbi:MAG TPA: hypothetical protein VK427_11080 [Kofleriaceae bacterium]|nr:hypothetical protein [Kofleriaceae bacterium]
MWFHLAMASVASVATMRAAMERGDVDEAARQGVIAGPAVVEAALAAPDRAARLAAIVAAPDVEGRAELLDALAIAAAGPDRRTAIPAARAARTIALELARRDLPDEIAGDDAIVWRDAWATLAMRRDRWIELRVFALETAAALDRAAAPPGIPPGTGVSLETALADPDPAFRRAAVHAVASPVSPPQRAHLAGVLAKDIDADVALAAANVMCFDLVDGPAAPVLDAIDASGMARLKTLVAAAKPKAHRDARRCLTAKR